jgi:WD40 repeat protein
MRTTIPFIWALCIGLKIVLSCNPAECTPPRVDQGQPSLLLAIHGHSQIALHAQYSPDGKRLATAAADNTAIVWNATTGERLFTLKGHNDYVTRVAFSPSGKQLATGSLDRTVKIWDPVTGRQTMALNRHNFWVYCVNFSPDGTQLATGDALALDKEETNVVGLVRFWDARTGKQMKTLQGHTNAVIRLTFSPNGKLLATGSIDGSVIVWDLASGKPALTLQVDRENVLALAFTPDGKQLATAGYEGIIKVWDLATGRETISLKGHKGRILDIGYSFDSSRLASVSLYDGDRSGTLSHGQIKTWDTATSKEQFTLETPKEEEGVYGVTFHPDGKQIATSHGDGTVKVWHLPTPSK